MLLWVAFMVAAGLGRAKPMLGISDKPNAKQKTQNRERLREKSSSIDIKKTKIAYDIMA